MNRKSAIAALALVLCSLTSSAPAADSLSSRAMIAVGAVIARQGDAALVQIRRELAESAREAMKPFLVAPQEDTEPTPTTPAEAPIGSPQYL